MSTALVVAAPVLALLTYIVIGPLGQGGSSTWLQLVLLLDFIYVLIIATGVLRQITRMVAARRARSAGSRLSLRLTGAFAFSALIPIVLVAVFSVTLISLAINGLFSDPVGNVLRTSLTTAQAYEQEHREELTRDGLSLAAYLNRERQLNLFMDDGEVRRILGEVQAQIERGLTEVFVIDGLGNITARGARSYEFGYERPSPEDFLIAEEQGISIVQDYANDEFRGLIPLSAFLDRYLYVTRPVDGNVLSLLDDTTETVAQYEELANARGRLLFQFGLLYLGFSLILILGAIWGGLWFAERLSRPVGRLVAASQRVGAGDLDVQVVEDKGDDEIADLGIYFNRMTRQLKQQRDELIETNRATERRRRLFDSVLSSVTSGVVGLDAYGRVTFVNPSAQRLLSVGSGSQNEALTVAVPEFADVFAQLSQSNRESVQQQVELMRKGQHESLLVRMAQRRNLDGTLEGYVVAFDDVTDLVSAQRMAAWGDVARRIAHEIKNPLTPIQLSAERIKRKFAGQVGDDADKLEQMTDVIVRQTNDLRRIVDEFSKFARMPEPEMQRIDLMQLIRDAVSLQMAGQPDVRFETDIPPQDIEVSMDGAMIGQALTNLIKNAGEATEAFHAAHPGVAYVPTIRLRVAASRTKAEIEISDNGIGLPQDRARLFEPYVTTRGEGTGLGLPIVKKIIEQHGGLLTLTDAEAFEGYTHKGARAHIEFPILAAASPATNKVSA